VRLIRKGSEPRGLLEYRLLEGARYEDLPAKQEVRAALIRDQHGLCCYCMQRIRDEPGGVRIEHWRSQAARPDLSLRWENLLAACPGNEGNPPRAQHCDVSKSDREITVGCDVEDAPPVANEESDLGGAATRGAKRARGRGWATTLLQLREVDRPLPDVRGAQHPEDPALVLLDVARIPSDQGAGGVQVHRARIRCVTGARELAPLLDR